MTSSRWFYSIVAILALFSLSVGQVFADLESCSASLNNHALNPNSTNSVSLSIQNQSANSATFMQVFRPSGNYHILSASVDGCSASTNDDDVRIGDCSLEQSQSITVSMDVGTDDVSPTESWNVMLSDNGGLTGISCGGDLSSTVGDGGGGGGEEDSGGDGGSGGTTLEISSVSVTGSATSATIAWSTNVAATSLVEYGTSTSYGSTSSSSDLSTSHAITITSLSTSSIYHFRITSVDESNNTVVTGDNTFTTSEEGSVESTSLSSSVTSVRITPTPTLPPDTTSPAIAIANNFVKPFSKVPTIGGNVSDDRNISKIEYSTDGGKNWYSSKFTRSIDQKTARFSFIPTIEEDGNYQLIARASDLAGNVGYSNKFTLIYDRTPPKIGGSIITSGSQIITANDMGVIELPSHVSFKILFTSIGGATDIVLNAVNGSTNKKGDSFRASRQEGTNVWSSEIKFTNSGEYQIQAEALDGANNRTTSLLAKIQIQKNGAVVSDGKPVEGASVRVFYLQNDTHTFSEWHARAYAQSNPLKTDASGGYSFTLPQGTYYVEVTAPGYNRLVSDVFSFDDTRALNADLVLREKPHIQIGSLKITIPVGFTDTHAIVLKEQSSTISKSKKENAIGNPIKEFSVVSNGKEITNNYFKGKSTLLVFSNTWLPQTQQAIQALSREKDYQTALVIPHESDSYIQTYKRRGGYDVTFIADKDGALLENLGINTIPSIVLIDSRGIVKDLRMGVFSMEPKK